MDYRPALRGRTGVGEYTHQLARALLETGARRGADAALDLVLFSSSWKDRVAAPPELARARVIDRRVPVSVLNFAWHRLGWPSAESMAGMPIDVTHSLHPLLLPSRAAAQVVTIHDLDFLTHPERTRAEIRRDYPALAAEHARRADAVVVVSSFTAGEVERHFGVPRERIAICPGGGPDWTPRTPAPKQGYVLFFGTLEARKNVGGLLDAFERLIARGGASVPELVLAGGATEAAAPWLDRIGRRPLAGRVRHVGYVEPDAKRALYDGARLLVQPSFEEGFGLTVLEAMTAGLPVVAANRGALPEVLGGAGLLVNPEDPDDVAHAIDTLLTDAGQADRCAARGVERARAFTWARTAQGVYDAYARAIERRARLTGANDGARRLSMRDGA
jgi:glycosyltransferase involved in cell wall biosynthesis